MLKLLRRSNTIMTLALLMLARNAMSIEYTAHVHGQAELTIAFEQEQISFNLVAPAETLFGFEHTASSSNEITKVASSKKYLSQFNNIIQFNKGKCQVNKIDMDMGVTAIEAHHEHSQDRSHKEVKISYQLKCRNAENITSASVEIFKQYPALKKVHVLWLGYSQQGSADLGPENTRISFH